MQFIGKNILLAIAMASAGLAQAQLSAQATITASGRSVGGYGFALGNLQGQSSLIFSPYMIGALSIADIETSMISPASGVVGIETISIDAPILSVSGSFTAHAPDAPARGPVSFSANKITTHGGATMVASKSNFATSGGSLTITDITLDLSAQGIYATVAGAHGVAAQTIRVWNFAKLDGVTTLDAGSGFYTADSQLSGLMITPEAFDLFAQGLGLTSPFITTMRSITNYGVVNSSLSMSTPLTLHDVDWVATIPEPSTYALMAAGLVGIVLSTKRRRVARIGTSSTSDTFQGAPT